MPKEPLRPHDPRRLGDYELIERLGEGGMGTVYLGRSSSGVLVAVKMVRADLAHDDEFRLRFRSEVERVRQVPPFCTAEVLDADPDHDRPYLVVEYVDGPTLAHVVEERGPLTAANLHSVAIGVATALTAIHGAGVIHRDLKPRNVLLAPGSPKVIDFGIARAVEGQSNTITGDGAMVGTVAYMAPERFGDEPLTPASDVFAWGGVVAYAGTGRTPFRGETPPVTAGRILTAEPNLDGLTGPLRDLVAYALAKNPADRPTARELLDLLISGKSKATAAALNGQPGLREAAAEAQSVMVGYREDAITTVPVSELPMPAPVPPDPEPARPRRWFLPVAVAVVVLAVLLGAGLLVFAPTVTSSNAAPAGSGPAPILVDDLNGPRLWQVSTEPDGITGCTFHGGLVAQVAARGLYKCTGPQDDLPLDLDAEVGVRLLTPNTCAAIWLRFTQLRGYLVEVCPTSVYVGTHRNQKVAVTRTLPLDQPIAPGGAATRIGLRTTAGSLEVTRDGRTVGTAPLTAADITGTGLLLGVVTDRSARDTGPFSVAFDHITVRRSTER